MNNNQIYLDVKKNIAELCNMNIEELKDDVNLIFYGLDSVRAIELAGIFEEQYHIELNDAELANITTIQSIIHCIENKL